MPRWLSWLNTSVSKQSKHVYQLSTQVYHAYKDEHNLSMQVINKRESEQSQIQGICFEVRAPLLYIPAFDTRRISTIIDPTGSLGAATPTTLGLPSPYTPQAHRLAEATPQTKSSHPNPKHRVHTRTRNNANTHIRLLKEQR